jgi:hypothetical protein
LLACSWQVHVQGSDASSSKGSSKAASRGAATVNLRVLDGEHTLLFETGLFTGVSSMDIDFERDVCFMLVDVDGKELATMWLHVSSTAKSSSSALSTACPHSTPAPKLADVLAMCDISATVQAAFLHEPSLVCDYRWWDVNRRHKGAKKFLKHCTIELMFQDGDHFAGNAGQTLPPCTDKEYRLGRPLGADEMEVQRPNAWQKHRMLFACSMTARLPPCHYTGGRGG